MALNGSEKLYMSSGASYRPVTTQEVADLAGAAPQAAAVADCVPAADGTSAGEQLNDLLASLRAAGVIAT